MNTYDLQITGRKTVLADSLDGAIETLCGQLAPVLDTHDVTGEEVETVREYDEN